MHRQIYRTVLSLKQSLRYRQNKTTVRVCGYYELQLWCQAGSRTQPSYISIMVCFVEVQCHMGGD